MESVIYIILWMTIKYLNNKMDAKTRFDRLNSLFDYRSSTPELGKEGVAMAGRRYVAALRLSCAQAFQLLLRDLLDAQRYNVIAVEDWDENWTEDQATALKQRIHSHEWMLQRLADFLGKSTPERDGGKNIIEAPVPAEGTITNQRISESQHVSEEAFRNRMRNEERRVLLADMKREDEGSPEPSHVTEDMNIA